MLLKKDTQNSLVKSLQEKLVELGYDVGLLDGIFGPKTEDEVLKHQRDKGLSALYSLEENRIYALCNKLRKRCDSGRRLS